MNNPYEEPNKGLVNPHRMEQVDIEAKRQRYAGRGKTNPPVSQQLPLTSFSLSFILGTAAPLICVLFAVGSNRPKTIT